MIQLRETYPEMLAACHEKLPPAIPARAPKGCPRDVLTSSSILALEAEMRQPRGRCWGRVDHVWSKVLAGAGQHLGPEVDRIWAKSRRRRQVFSKCLDNFGARGGIVGGNFSGRVAGNISATLAILVAIASLYMAAVVMIEGVLLAHCWTRRFVHVHDHEPHGLLDRRGEGRLVLRRGLLGVRPPEPTLHVPAGALRSFPRELVQRLRL